MRQVTNHNRKLGVALLSCARHQENYAPYFVDHPNLEIVAVADEPEIAGWIRGQNQEFAARYQVPYTENIDSVLGSDGVDIVSVCAEPARRAQLAVRAARAGKHIFMDKPMATTLEQCNQVVAAVSDHGVKFMVVNRLFVPAIQQAKMALATGTIGLPTAIHTTWVVAKGIRGWSPEELNMVIDPEFSDGGELLNFAVYPIGHVRYLTGCEVRTVYALRANYFYPEHAKRGVEDFGILALTLDRGIVVTIVVGRAPTASHPQGADRKLTIIGSQGMLVVEESQPALTVYGDEHRGVQSRYLHGNLMHEVSRHRVDHFVRCVLDDEPSIMDARDGRAIVEVILAAYESAAENRVVDLPLTADS